MSVSGAHLIIRHDPSTQQEYMLPAQTVTMGREAFNEIVLYDPEVSRQHTEISFQAGHYVVQDLGSTNGTFLNGRRINAPSPLNDGDIIEVGEGVSITFRSTTGSIDKTTIEPPPVRQPAAPAPPAGVQYGAPTPPAQQSRPQETPPAWGAPAAAAATPVVAATPAPEEQRDQRRVALGIGCLIFLVVVICAATVFLLDAFASDALYCGPFQSLFELLGFDFTCV